MTYLGENQPTISGTLQNGNQLADGQYILLSDDVAMSGSSTYAAIQNVAGTSRLRFLTGGPAIDFGPGNNLYGIQYSASQMSLYWNNAIKAYWNSTNFDLNGSALSGYIERTSSITAANTSVPIQDKGRNFHNASAAQTVNIEINYDVTAGASHKFFCSNENYGMICNFKSSGANRLIAETGMLDLGVAVHLSGVGAFLHVHGVGNGWFIVDSRGIIDYPTSTI